MTSVDAQELRRLCKDWNRIDLDEMAHAGRNAHTLDSIREGLEDMGLDLSQDATYEMLEPGLTRAAFDTAVAIAIVRDVNQTYAAALRSDNQYVDIHHMRCITAMKRLRDYLLPQLQDALSVSGMPQGLMPFERRQCDLIVAMSKDGTLDDTIRRNAIKAAHSAFRRAVDDKKAVDRTVLGAQSDLRPVKEGLRHVDEALEYIQDAGPYYAPADVVVEFGMHGYVKGGATAAFNIAALKDMRDFFLMGGMTVKFACAMEFHKQGQFVLDSSGGYGAMVLPMQDILTGLQERGKDLRDPAVYTAMGTDIDTFWDAYARERQAVQNDPQYKKMVGPEFRR